VLVLLIIFMLTSAAIVRASMVVNCPRPQARRTRGIHGQPGLHQGRQTPAQREGEQLDEVAAT